MRLLIFGAICWLFVGVLVGYFMPDYRGKR